MRRSRRSAKTCRGSAARENIETINGYEPGDRFSFIGFVAVVVVGTMAFVRVHHASSQNQKSTD
jgi:hypothetical protein